MYRLFNLVILSILLLSFSISLTAQDNANGMDLNGWKITGKAEMIPYLDGRDFDNKTYAPTYTTAEFRAGVSKDVNKHLDFKLEFQNSHVFGETGSVMNHGSSVGMVQGYANFKNIFGQPLKVKVGRFHVAYGDGRFIHRSPWNYVERSFDGTMITYHPENTKIDLLLSTESTSINYHPLAASSSKPLHGADYTDSGIFGLFVTQQFAENHELIVLAFLEDDPSKSESDVKLLERYTVGAEYMGKAGKVDLKGSFGYQFGTQSDVDIAAYLGNFEAKYWLMKTLGLMAGVEVHSGQDPEKSDEIGLFNNRLAAKHRFFGYMDYFVNAGTSGATGGLGVNGILVGAQYKSKNKKWMGKAIIHHFMSNQESLDGENTYGQEVNLLLRYNLQKGIFVEWGGGVFIASDLMKQFWGGNEDPAFMSFFRTLIML